MATASGLILPNGAAAETAVVREGPSGGGVLVNDTGLPDEQVHAAVETYVEEHASLLGLGEGNMALSLYNAGANGSFLNRNRFQLPSNVFDEIALARNLAERDDDVRPAMALMLATAFGDGMQNAHADEVVVELYDKVAEHADLDMLFQECYRELLIAASFTTACQWGTESFQLKPEGSDRARTKTIQAPMVAVLPAEQIRVIGSDAFGNGQLAYKPATASQERWLNEFFADTTSAARKAEMRRQDPVLTNLLVEEIPQESENVSLFYDANFDPPTGRFMYRMNPLYTARSSFPKGAMNYARPLMTTNFPLLEAKRLLNLMDHALLQGGSNFLVVAKKGSDQRPALPEEVAGLREAIRRSSRTGVIVGDHRVSIEIITPDLTELLNPGKRKLLGRKLAMAMLRVPEHMTDNPAAEGMRAEVEFLQRIIANDRLLIRRHVTKHVYGNVEKRNSTVNGRAKIIFPKIVLQGTQAFTDYVLKLRDRGDIPRRYAVEAAGFDYDAALAGRKREKANGDDRVLTVPTVPWSSAGEPPADNGGGRPAGGSPNNGLPGARQGTSVPLGRPAVTPRGETVRAMYDDELDQTFSIGELTHAMLEQYPDAKQGRVTPFERDALARVGAEEWGVVSEGPLAVVPVNPGYDIEDVRAVALAPGVRMLVGKDCETGAIVARAFSFAEPYFKPVEGAETAIRWGFVASLELPAPAE